MLLGAELGDEVFETLIDELCLIVDHERLWYPKLGEYVLFVETEDIV